MAKLHAERVSLLQSIMDHVDTAVTVLDMPDGEERDSRFYAVAASMRQTVTKLQGTNDSRSPVTPGSERGVTQTPNNSDAQLID